MRGVGKVVVFWLGLTLCAAAAGSPVAAANEPAESGKADDTSWGVLLRGGYFGLPNFIADELFTRHPDIEGANYGAEIRYHGNGGGRGIASLGLAIDFAEARADGVWQQDASKTPKTASGEISFLGFTLTGYWSLFPSWYVHPYVGLGVGLAYVKGQYTDQEVIEVNEWLPVVHIPVGLAVELGKRLQLSVEGRFFDGIAYGGALQFRF